MTSFKRVAANRRNASRSTGPRTVAGKAVSSTNALKHGLTADRRHLLSDESGADFENLEAGFMAAWEPVGTFEAYLVRRLAELAWKVARAGRIEAELLEAEIGATEMDQLAAIAGGLFDRDIGPIVEPTNRVAEVDEDHREKVGRGTPSTRHKLRLGSAFMRLSIGEDVLGRAIRYQGEAERLFYKTSSALERLQRSRRGEHVEAPVAVEVNVAPGVLAEQVGHDRFAPVDMSPTPVAEIDSVVEATTENQASTSEEPATPGGTELPSGRSVEEEVVALRKTFPETNPTEALPPEVVIKKPETKPTPTPAIYVRDRYTFGR